MAAVNLNLIDKFLKQRLEVINKSKRTLSLGDDLYSQTLSTFTSLLTSFLDISGATDANFFKQSFDKLFTSMVQPLPEKELSATGINKLMHNKFSLLAQSILSHPSSGDFFHAAIKDGCDIMQKQLNDFNSNNNKIKNLFIGHLTELPAYIAEIQAHPERSFLSIVTALQPELSSKADDLYFKLFEMYSYLAKDKDFSPSKALQIFNLAKDLTDTLSGVSGLKSMPNSLGSLTNALSQSNDVATSAQEIFDNIDNMKDIDTKMRDGIDYNSVFSKNIKQILNMGRSVRGMVHNLSNLSGQRADAMISAAQQVNTMIPYIQSFMKGMSEKNMFTKLFAPGPNRDMLDTLKADLSALTHPKDEVNDVVRDLHATIKITKDLANGILPPNNAPAVLIGRLEDKFNTIESYVNMATAAYTAFKPVIDSVADTAYKAMKASANTPMKSLSLGNIVGFSKALINPKAITKVGPVMDELSKFISENEDLTVTQAFTATKLKDFVVKEFVRESITTYLADSDMQKAVALAGLSSYVKTDLEPVNGLMTQFKNLF